MENNEQIQAKSGSGLLVLVLFGIVAITAILLRHLR